jgi:hypothetical protein
MKRGNVVLPRFGWNEPDLADRRWINSESKGRHHYCGETKHDTEDTGKFQRIAHGILGLGLLFKRGFIAEVRGGSGTLIEEGSFCAHGGEFSGWHGGSKGKRFPVSENPPVISLNPEP